MMTVAEQSGTLKKRFYVGSRSKTLFADLCKNLSAIYELTLLPVQDSELLNDIDKLFQRRLQGFEAHLSVQAPAEFQPLDCTAVENSHDPGGLLQSLHRSHHTAGSAARAVRGSQRPLMRHFT